MICEKCGKEHDGSFGSGRFCSRGCANSRNDDKQQTKQAQCNICGLPIFINKRSDSHKCLCNDCKRIKYESEKLKSYKRKLCKICGRYGCTDDRCRSLTRKFLLVLCKYFGLNEHSIGTIRIFDDVESIRNKLYDLYVNQHLTSGQICVLYDYPHNSNFTGFILKKLHIESKSVSQAVSENVLQYGCLPHTNKFKCGYHTTWVNQQVFLRSSYEFDFAKFLDRFKIQYSVEKLRIRYWDSVKNKFRVAVPDFYLKDFNCIVEVKSSFTLDVQNMKDKVCEYKKLGYKFKLMYEHRFCNLDDF